MAYWRTQGSLTTRMVREFLQECDLPRPSDGAHPLYAGRHVEKAKAEEPAAEPEPTLLDVIDGHIKTLFEMGEVRLLSPDQRTNWCVGLRARGVTVFYRNASTHSTHAWRELNPGWSFSDRLKPIDGARIVIGQILVGARQSGMRLEGLTCSHMISDIPARHCPVW